LIASFQASAATSPSEADASEIIVWIIARGFMFFSPFPVCTG
jgi:hypothetical protein